MIREDKQFRYLSEQVCHHPPVSACYCDSPDYAFWTEVYVKSKFWGKSLELQPLGNCHVRLPVYGNPKVTSEHFSWKKVTTCVNNLILGTLAIEHYGDMIITNHRTQETCIITFKPKDVGGWFIASKEPTTLGGDIIGQVKDGKGVLKFELRGRWDEYLMASPVTPNSYSNGSINLWKVTPKSPSAQDYFHLTNFALTLNQSSSILDSILPLTDSRVRPDQRAMERGDWEVADKKKEECESRQRARRKEIVELFEQNGIPYGPPMTGIEFGEKWWSPRWFSRKIDPDTGDAHWKFTGEYWKLRSQISDGSKSWPTYVEDLFGTKE